MTALFKHFEEKHFLQKSITRSIFRYGQFPTELNIAGGIC